MVRYSAYRKKQAGGRYVWGVLRQEGRKQNFRTVGEGDDAQAGQVNRARTPWKEAQIAVLS